MFFWHLYCSREEYPVKLMKLSKTLLALLTTGLFSCGLFSQQAHATAIQGNINFAGSVHLNNNNLALATSVVTWLDSFNNAGKSAVVPGNDGDFAGILAGTSATNGPALDIQSVCALSRPVERRRFHVRSTYGDGC
jgi:hypothetical protein